MYKVSIWIRHKNRRMRCNYYLRIFLFLILESLVISKATPFMLEMFMYYFKLIQSAGTIPPISPGTFNLPGYIPLCTVWIESPLL